MKKTSVTRIFCATVAAGLYASSANAALLSLDFGTDGNGTPFTETGFTAQTADGVIHSTTAGNITVTFTDESGFFSRTNNNSGASPNTVLHDDFVYVNSASTFTMTLSGPGITVSTPYQLTLWAWDSNSSANQTFTGVSGTVGTAALSFANSPAPSTLSDYSVTQTFTSDSSGNITIAIAKTNFSSGDGSRLNGLVLSAIPEPSSIALLGLGGLALMVRRRR